MRIVKLLLVGACITVVSASFADSKAGAQSDTKTVKQQPALSFTNSRTYTCPGMAPITVHETSNSKVYTAIASHLSTLPKMPSEYECTVKMTISSSHSSRTFLSTHTGFLILKNPSVAGNEKSGFILMADKVIKDDTSNSKRTAPLFESSSTEKSHMEISKFNSLKNPELF